jgi:hypothetical protein
MIKFLKNLFGVKPAEPAVEAPYKVEAPTPVAEKATEAVVTSIAPVAEKPAKAPRAKKPAAMKAPKAPKAPKEPKVKAPAKPRAPKKAK